MHIEKLLGEVVQMLDSLRIPYLLTESLAYNIYSLPRSTRDIDIIIEIQEKDIKRFLKFIEGTYYYFRTTDLMNISTND